MAVVFWSFRVMVGLGMLMIMLGLISAFQFFRGKLFESPWLQRWWIMMLPSGFVALLAGWFVTEVGRQPYTVFGVIRTAASVSPAITASQLQWSLLAFVVVYTSVLSAGTYYIFKLMRQGLDVLDEKGQIYKTGMEAAVVGAALGKGDDGDKDRV